MVDAEVILEHIIESVVITDPLGHVCFFNPMAVQYSNQERRRIKTGIPVQELCSDENKFVLSLAMEMAKETGEPQTIEVPLKQNGGNKTYLEVQVEPILNAQGETSWLCIVASDITEQKMWERKAAELERSLSELTENANAVIFSVDSQCYVTAWNGICAQLTGFHANNVLAKPLRYFIHDGNFAETTDILEEVLLGNVRSIEFRMHVLSGGEKKFLVNATPRRNAKSDVIGILFVGQDITELSDYRTRLEWKVLQRTEQLKAALSKEQQLVEIKNKFIAIASHEFRTPLRAISAHVRSIQSGEGLSSAQLERLTSIEKQAAHMNDLLEDILTIEKSKLHQLEGNLRNVNLINLLDRIIQEVQTATGHTHHIEKNYPDQNVFLLSDENLLRNIFLNLVTNAIKFSSAGETVFIDVSRQAEHIVVAIEDNGIGIPREDHDHIFEAFTRASNAKLIPGTGLGLSIVKRASDVLGAELQLLSDADSGTKVYVKFLRENM